VTVMLNAHAPACIKVCMDILGGKKGGGKPSPGTLPDNCSRWGWPVLGQALALGQKNREREEVLSVCRPWTTPSIHLARAGAEWCQMHLMGRIKISMNKEETAQF